MGFIAFSKKESYLVPPCTYMNNFKIGIKHSPTVYVVYRSSAPESEGVAKSVDRYGAQSVLNQLKKKDCVLD